MDVALSPDLEQFVQVKLQSGRFASASEVVREGLRLLKEQEDRESEKLAELRREIQVGIDQADRGETLPLTDDLVRDIKERGKQRLGVAHGPSGT